MEKSIDYIKRELIKHGIKKEKIEEISDAYEIAVIVHQNQKRQSGEPYIIHPINVAINLIEREIYDPDTICAALLHDTIEDAPFSFTKSNIAKAINPTVAEIVDGVTKIRGLDLQEDAIDANTRKIVIGLTKDIRIILVKLADRLHNMQTLSFKSRERQIANAKETLTIFVPLANAIGAYKIKEELEDLSIMYLYPEIYERIKLKRMKLRDEKRYYLDATKMKIEKILKENKLDGRIEFREKNIYRLYKEEQQGYNIDDIYDAFYLKVIVNTKEDCYRAMGLIHGFFKPLHGYMKDYIGNYRTNFYQSLNTTVSLKDACDLEEIVKIKIRTEDMNKVAAYGIPAYWNIGKGISMAETKELVSKLPLENDLKVFDTTYITDKHFVEKVCEELLSEKVYIYTYSATPIELPKGSTVDDFINKMSIDTSNISEVIVNGKVATKDKELMNNDRIKIKYINNEYTQLSFDDELKDKTLIKTMDKKNIPIYN